MEAKKWRNVVASDFECSFVFLYNPPHVCLLSLPFAIHLLSDRCMLVRCLKQPPLHYFSLARKPIPSCLTPQLSPQIVDFKVCAKFRYFNKWKYDYGKGMIRIGHPFSFLVAFWLTWKVRNYLCLDKPAPYPLTIFLSKWWMHYNSCSNEGIQPEIY